MKSGDKMLRIKELDFSYKEKNVLKNINMSIREREFIGIIGPNGSGKSTLLKNISNVLIPDSGIIYLDQELLNDYEPLTLAKQMAVVPQESRINFNFSVYELVMMGRNPYQNRWGRITEKDRSIVEEAMDLTDTWKFKERKITELSSGERQRVIIARALAQQPDILLLDEPTASLDINYCQGIFDFLSHLNKNLKITIIAVSHDLNLTSQYCDRLILLNEGQIYVVGSPEKVLTTANISEVYNTDIKIINNPLTDRPYLILGPGDYNQDVKSKNGGKIHVICGGGSGKKLLEELYHRGYTLSCGVLNQGDADWEMAKKLNLDLVEIPPFASIDQVALQKNQVYIKRADLVLITNTPFGYGNIANLELISEMEGKKIILQQKNKFYKRDYTGGKARKYWEKIVERKYTYSVADQDELIGKISGLITKD